MLRRQCLKFGLVASLIPLLEARQAEAGQFVPIPLRELVKSSARIWLATPVERHCEWVESPVGRLIVTHTRVACDHDVVPGEPRAGELWVQTLGGTVGKTGQLVHGEARLRVGERCLLFVAKPGERHVVNGMAQGHYAVRSIGGVQRLKLSPAAEPLRARARSAAAVLADLELDAAFARIRGEAS